MATEFKFQVDPDRSFQRAVKKAAEQVSDLRVPFGLIAKSWFKGNIAIFSLKGPGKYKDLARSTKATKMRLFGTPYPILRFSGDLEDSLTNPGSSNSINESPDKVTLLLGTSIAYAPFLQFGTRNMPARPPVLLGPEQVAPAALNRRREAWIDIIRQYVEQKTGEAFL